MILESSNTAKLSESPMEDLRHPYQQPFPEENKYDCRCSYWSLINTTLYRQFPRFVTNLRNQSSDQCELGRAVVFDFREGERAVATQFKGSGDLRRYLFDHTQQKPSCVIRRLWVLEDLSRNYIEALGSGLRIPPSFFAAHWADPIGADFNERDSFVSNPRQSFLLNWPQFYRVSIDRPVGDLACSLISNVERHLFFCGQEDTTYENPLYARMYHKISYWSTEYPGKSWDAVLLVDPPLKRSVMVLPTCEIRDLHFQPGNESHPEIKSPDLFPAFTSPATLSKDYREWTVSRPEPRMQSMLDDLVSLQHDQHHDVSEDPRTCTSICRKIVISMWIAFIRRRFLNLLSVNTLVSVTRTETDFLNRASWAKREWDSSWHQGIFSDLVNARFKLDIVRTEVASNLAALGLTQPTISAVENAHAEEWEITGWDSVLRLASTVEQMVEIFKQSYSQGASIQETKTANDLTRSVNKITTVTIFLLPISVISGIFSMGGSFSPGESKYWVFWVVICPVLLLTALLVFTNPIQFIKAKFKSVFGQNEAHELPLFED